MTKKRKNVPKAVTDRICKKLGIERGAYRMRIYRHDIALIEMIKTEIEIYEKEQKEAAEIAENLRKTIHERE